MKIAFDIAVWPVDLDLMYEFFCSQSTKRSMIDATRSIVEWSDRFVVAYDGMGYDVWYVLLYGAHWKNIIKASVKRERWDILEQRPGQYPRSEHKVRYWYLQFVKEMVFMIADSARPYRSWLVRIQFFSLTFFFASLSYSCGLFLCHRHNLNHTTILYVFVFHSTLFLLHIYNAKEEIIFE